jgi:iron(III) transport system permease protein
VTLKLDLPMAARERSAHRMDVFGIAAGAIAAVTIILIVYPLVVMIGRGFADSGLGAWGKVLSASWLPKMIGDTAFVVGTGSVLSLVFAGFLAWVNERTNAGLGKLTRVLPLIPLFLPMVAMAIGWVILATPRVGLLNGALSPLGLQVNIFSYAGMVFIYMLHGVPYAYLPIAAAFQNLDPALEEAARTSGASSGRIFRTISLPAIRPAIISAFMLVLVVNLAMYAVPAILGTRSQIDILSVRIIRSVRGTYPPAYDIAIVLSTVLFIILAVLWMAQQRGMRHGRFAKIGGRSSGQSAVDLGRWIWPVRILSLAYLACSSVLPAAALAIVSLQSYWQPVLTASHWTLQHFRYVLIDYSTGQLAILNSLRLALIGGGAIVLLATVLGVFTSRRHGPLRTIVDSASRLPAVVPHTVIALSFIFALAGPPFRLGGTLAILALAYLVVYLPYAAITTEASIAQVDRSLEEASATSGATAARTFLRINLPLILPGVFAAWALVFVHILSDLSVAVLLGTGRTPVIGYVLLDIFESGSYSRLSALAITMSIITIPIVLLMLRLGRPVWRARA